MKIKPKCLMARLEDGKYVCGSVMRGRIKGLGEPCQITQSFARYYCCHKRRSGACWYNDKVRGRVRE